jgi:hypothetical protein
MDFIIGLPKSKGKSVIMVIVDRLTKYTHFYALSHPFKASTVAITFMETVQKIHGSVITLIFTRHAYLDLGHLRFFLFQNTTKQLFLKTPFIKAHSPCSITARVYMLTNPRQLMCTYKRTKKRKLMTKHTTLGKLTKSFGHAWSFIRPNT